jgi:haloacetate dehalogenase
MHWFENFEVRHFDTQGARIHAHVSPGLPAGRPALLLLHGFPQTHVMWHRVAQLLQKDFYLVMPDLRGYGDSSKAPGLADHSNYSKRAMAQDMVDVMDALGVAQFDLCGHDRGGRVAHRLAVDHPARVRRLCVIDIAPVIPPISTAHRSRTVMQPWPDAAVIPPISTAHRSRTVMQPWPDAALG